jgi:hypothetical protein
VTTNLAVSVLPLSDEVSLSPLTRVATGVRSMVYVVATARLSLVAVVGFFVYVVVAGAPRLALRWSPDAPTEKVQLLVIASPGTTFTTVWPAAVPLL